MPVGELLSRIPSDYRRGDIPEGNDRVDLPCADLLQGNTPRLSLGILGSLLPGLVVVPEGGHGTSLDLPAGWIAGHYRLVTLCEEIPPADLPEEDAAMPNEAVKDTVADSKDNDPPKEEEAPSIASEKKAEVTVVSESSGQEPKGEVEEALPVDEVKTQLPRKADKAERAETKVGESKEEAADLPARKPGFFASLPIFRRRHAREASESSAPTHDEAGESPSVIVEPVTPVTEPAMPASKPKQDPPSEAALIRVEASESAPVVALEPLWKFDPQDQLADPSALQALFMTEEKLTLEGVVSKAGELPGLNACVLAHGDRVICASKTPAGVDLQTLSGHALTMLSQIRESSSKMGLGAVPAVTLHADQGVVSFLHKGELCLLVLHADRGFVPGVRERLQEMLGHLADARPMLNGRSEQG